MRTFKIDYTTAELYIKNQFYFKYFFYYQYFNLSYNNYVFIFIHDDFQIKYILI